MNEEIPKVTPNDNGSFTITNPDGYVWVLEKTTYDSLCEVITNQPTSANSAEKKTAEDFIKEGNEGYPLRDVIDNLTDEQIIQSANHFAAHIAKLAVTEALKRASKVPYGKIAFPEDMAKAILSIADEIDEIIKEVSE